MIVVHMDSGLGNQMLDYAEYLAICKMNPDKEVVLEDLIYELPDDRPGMFSKWNGYELEQIFGLKAPELKDRVSDEAWHRMVRYLEESRFWEKQWNYAPVITEALRKEGISLCNLQKNSRSATQEEQKRKNRPLRKAITSFFQTEAGYHCKRYMKKVTEAKVIAQNAGTYNVFQQYDDNVFTGHSLMLKYKGMGIEQIDQEIRKAFTFPPITDEDNRTAMRKIRNCNSVAIHARRSDMLFLNAYCYKYGFFKRAVKYIKKHVENPVFFFFCDELSRGWCEENEKIFGLDFEKDHIEFVTWNSGKDSYRDMQLMAQCKHNIFTESSFGFWGAYLNENPDKITCAPDPTILATNWF